MFGLGTSELLLILVVVVMFFGVGKLPEVAKQLGGGIRTFRQAASGDDTTPTKEDT